MALADQPNYQTVSDGLNYAPSTLNRHIRMLERELEVELFKKMGRNVVLTEKGQLFYPRARSIVREYEAACRELTGEENRALLSIGGCEVILTWALVDLLSDFVKEYPDIQLSTTTSSNSQVPELVRNGTNEIGFYYSETDPSSGNLHATAILREQKYRVIVSPEHPLAARKNLRFGDLEGLSIACPHISCYSVSGFLQILEERNIRIGTVSGFGVLSLALDQVRMNGMAMIAPYSAARKIAEKDGLCILDIREIIPEFTRWIIYHEDSINNTVKKMLQFSMDFAAKQIAASPQWFSKAE